MGTCVNPETHLANWQEGLTQRWLKDFFGPKPIGVSPRIKKGLAMIAPKFKGVKLCRHFALCCVHHTFRT